MRGRCRRCGRSSATSAAAWTSSRPSATSASGAAVPDLAPLLEGDPYVPVRAAAATALGRLGGPEAQAALDRALRREREAPVLESIRAALATGADPSEAAGGKRLDPRPVLCDRA